MSNQKLTIKQNKATKLNVLGVASYNFIHDWYVILFIFIIQAWQQAYVYLHEAIVESVVGEMVVVVVVVVDVMVEGTVVDGVRAASW